MSLVKRFPTLSSSLDVAEQSQAVGLIGSHRHFVRNWSACLTPSELTAVRARARRVPVEALEDAYSIAGRCLAEWSGRPWTADVIMERPSISANYSRSFLLAPTPITRPADVTACVEALLTERRRAPEFWIDGRETLLYALCTLVAEMGQNICEHSQNIGCVTVCWHEGGRENRPLVSVGVVDAGIGIRSSIVGRLRDAGQPADLDDAAAIARAFELPYPTEDQHRGTGLRMSRALIHRFDGVMHVRSGSAVVTMGPLEQVLIGRCASRHVPVPGAQICVYLTPPGG